MYLCLAFIWIRHKALHFSVTIVLILRMRCVNATRCTVLTNIKARTIDVRPERSRYTREWTKRSAPLLQREEDLEHRHAFWIVRSTLFARRTSISHDTVLEMVSHWVHFCLPLNYLTLDSSEIDVSLSNDHLSWNNTQQWCSWNSKTLWFPIVGGTTVHWQLSSIAELFHASFLFEKIGIR